MGAGASAADSDASEDFPERMTREETAKFAQELNWSGKVNLFVSFKGTDGLVSRKSIVSLAQNSTEQEMYLLFTEYTVGDSMLMDNSTFLDLLRDAKILSKSDLTTHYASMIFKEHAIKQDPPKRLNFTYFRAVMIPILAEKKRLSVDALLSKFCHFENRKAAEDLILAKTLDEADEDRPVEENTLPLSTSEAHSAAHKLQSLSRKKTANRHTNFMRQCSVARLDPQVAEEMVLRDHVKDEADAASLLTLFTRYTEYYTTNYEYIRCLQRKGELDRKQFVAMCSDAKLIERMKFSVGDSNQVFDKAIAIALNPASDPQYKEEIFFGKRIGFSVFRDIVISCLAEKSNMDVKAVIAVLLATPENAIDMKEKMNLGELSVRSAAS